MINFKELMSEMLDEKVSSRPVPYIKAVLSLFKAVPNLGETDSSNFEETQKKFAGHGVFVTEKAGKNCHMLGNEEIEKFICDSFGYDLNELNQGFYKSFGTVAEKSVEELLANQILHYVSTYGFEMMGIYNQNTVFIPPDKLELPKNSKPLKVVVIDLIEEDEIRRRTIQTVMSGAALSEETMKSVISILWRLQIKIPVDDVPNKELKIRICELMYVLPADPAEFLRYMVYVVTGKTLLIKNRETFTGIGMNLPGKNAEKYFQRYIKDNGIEKLAAIFFRFKPLFLAFKKGNSPYMKKTINKIRKLAETFHRPVKPKILDLLTQSENLDPDEIKNELEKIFGGKCSALQTCRTGKYCLFYSQRKSFRQGICRTKKSERAHFD